MARPRASCAAVTLRVAPGRGETTAKLEARRLRMSARISAASRMNSSSRPAPGSVGSGSVTSVLRPRVVSRRFCQGRDDCRSLRQAQRHEDAEARPNDQALDGTEERLLGGAVTDRQHGLLQLFDDDRVVDVGRVLGDAGHQAVQRWYDEVLVDGGDRDREDRLVGVDGDGDLERAGVLAGVLGDGVVQVSSGEPGFDDRHRLKDQLGVVDRAPGTHRRLHVEGHRGVVRPLSAGPPGRRTPP